MSEINIEDPIAKVTESKLAEDLVKIAAIVGAVYLGGKVIKVVRLKIRKSRKK
jgi:hypothetical protein